MKSDLIAPCGMNCGLCVAYLREENKCPGCFSGRKVNNRPIKCGIKLCPKRKGDFCDCDDLPCDRLERLDKRYREKYGMSEIENLKTIKEEGIDHFIEQQEERYVNSEGTYCVHDKKRYKLVKQGQKAENLKNYTTST